MPDLTELRLAIARCKVEGFDATAKAMEELLNELLAASEPKESRAASENVRHTRHH